MSGLRDWIARNKLLALVALVLGAGVVTTTIVFGFVLLVVLIAEAPFLVPILAGLLLLALSLAWVAARRGYLSIGSDADESEESLDPVEELERRYVRGEIGDEEFEHRLSVLLDADERAGREHEWDRDRDRDGDREVAFER